MNMFEHKSILSPDYKPEINLFPHKSILTFLSATNNFCINQEWIYLTFSEYLMKITVNLYLPQDTNWIYLIYDYIWWETSGILFTQLTYYQKYNNNKHIVPQT